MATPTLAEVLKDAKRELALRQSVFPKWVREGRLTQTASEDRIACQSEAVRIIERALEFERLSEEMRATWPQSSFVPETDAREQTTPENQSNGKEGNHATSPEPSRVNPGTMVPAVQPRGAVLNTVKPNENTKDQNQPLLFG